MHLDVDQSNAERHTLFCMEKLMKLVSTKTWYGGPSAVLCLKKSAADTLGLNPNIHSSG